MDPMEVTPIDNVLDMLHATLKTEYLSDLRYCPEVRRKLPLALDAIPEEAFPIEKWNAALTYLYGRSLEFESVSSAKSYCLQHPMSATRFTEGLL